MARVLLTQPDGAVVRHLVTFGTMTTDLLALPDWLERLGGTPIARESAGVYWRPVFNLLAGDGRARILVTPQPMKAAPGRKTALKDAAWPADRLRHGLPRASFIPPVLIRALRELTRYRKTRVQQRADEVNRVQKPLEGANLKLAAVATAVLGVSGRAMLTAILDGEADPEVLAALAKGRPRAKGPALRHALDGRVKPHHRVRPGPLLAPIEFLAESIARLTAEIARCPVPVADAAALLATIPGIGAVAAAALVAEIGVDRGRFPSAKHLASWAGVRPDARERGGKRRSRRTGEGNVWLRGLLGEVARSAARSKGTYLHARYHRLARRRGKHEAAVAVAHTPLVMISHVLTARRPHAELGADSFDRLDAARLERHHGRRLEHLGFTVTLTPKQAA